MDRVIVAIAGHQVIAQTTEQHIGPVAAKQRVILGAAIQGIFVDAAIQRVVALIAVQRVDIILAKHDIVASAAIQQVDAVGRVRVGGIGNIQLRIAGAAVDRIVADAAINRIGAMTGVDQISAIAGFNIVIVDPGGDRVVAGAAKDRVGIVAGDDRVIAGAAIDQIAAIVGVRVLNATEQAERFVGIVAECVDPGVDVIIAATAIDGIRPKPGVDRVVAQTPKHQVGVNACIDGIGPVAAIDAVGIVAGGDAVIAKAAIDQIAVVVRCRVHRDPRDHEIVVQRVVAGGVDDITTVAAIGTVIAVAAGDAVIARTARQAVIAITAVQCIVATAARQRIVAGAARQLVRAGAAGQAVISCTAVDVERAGGRTAVEHIVLTCQDEILDLGKGGGAAGLGHGARFGAGQVDGDTSGQVSHGDRVADAFTGFTAGNGVIAECRCQQEDIVAGTAGQVVCPCPAVQRVVAILAIQRVIAVLALKPVIAVTAIDLVVAIAGPNSVIARPGPHMIVLRCGTRQHGVIVVDLVALRIAGVAVVDQVIAGCAIDITIQPGGRRAGVNRFAVAVAAVAIFVELPVAGLAALITNLALRIEFEAARRVGGVPAGNVVGVKVPVINGSVRRVARLFETVQYPERHLNPLVHHAPAARCAVQPLPQPCPGSGKRDQKHRLRQSR